RRRRLRPARADGHAPRAAVRIGDDPRGAARRNPFGDLRAGPRTVRRQGHQAETAEQERAPAPRPLVRWKRELCGNRRQRYLLSATTAPIPRPTSHTHGGSPKNPALTRRIA